MKNKFYIFIILTTVLQSCVEEFVPELNPEEQKIVTIAELEAGELSIIHVGSTFAPGMPELDIDHDLSVIKIINFEEGNKPEEYRYDHSIQAYRTFDFRPNAGAIYDLNIDPRLNGVPAVHARTQVPYSTDVNILEEQVEAKVFTGSTGTQQSRIDISVAIGENLKNENYFHMLVYLTNGASIDFADNTNTQNAIHVLNHRDGILIDKTKLENADSLHFTLESPLILDIPETEPLYLKLDLRTVTPDYYHYHMAISRQSLTNAGPYTLPVTSYTNIENGYGIFAAFSATRDSVPILE